jgi:predicted Zn-dependent protease
MALTNGCFCTRCWRSRRMAGAASGWPGRSCGCVAADLEATMDKHPATPSSVLPARELLADLLLEFNQSAAALTEYKEMLRTDPTRFRSILGEARAAQQLGDAAAAHDAYQKLVVLSGPATPERPELADAKSYLTN